MHLLLASPCFQQHAACGGSAANISHALHASKLGPAQSSDAGLDSRRRPVGKCQPGTFLALHTRHIPTLPPSKTTLLFQVPTRIASSQCVEEARSPLITSRKGAVECSGDTTDVCASFVCLVTGDEWLVDEVCVCDEDGA